MPSSIEREVAAQLLRACHNNRRFAGMHGFASNASQYV